MSRAKSVTVWVLQILLAVFYALQAWMKLSSSPSWVTKFRAWGYPEHFYLVVGLMELLGAIALVIPGFVRLGAYLLIVVMLGATATHLWHREIQVITGLVLIALLVIVVWARRPSQGGNPS
jgi:putative oxidoreductase